MALYDNKHWLLSHIRNSFISSDDTGMCEMVMLGEDLPRKISSASKFECYPGVDESDEEDDELDVLGQSFDIQSDLEFGAHRQRSNTAQRLEKMDQERKKAAKTKHIKWERSSATLTDEERRELFERKDFRNKLNELKPGAKIQSLLSEHLEKSPHLPHNPFLEYSKYDGSAQVGVVTRKYGIFLTMLPPPERDYPMHVAVLSTAKVSDLIGLICWKYTLEHENHNFKDSVDYYGLYIAEDDGEVDWDFPCLEAREVVAKFGFAFLALVERTEKSKETEAKAEESFPIFDDEPDTVESENMASKSRVLNQENEDLKRMQGHMTAMEAPLYQSYRVYIVNKVRTKTEINLGVSGEKIEIDPVVQQKMSAKFWNRQKAVSYDMDNVVACDLTDTKSSSRATFRLTYHYSVAQGTEQASSLQTHSASSTFKHHDFEADLPTADNIVQKVNHILELRSSIRRREYLAFRERKSHRRRSFHLGSR